MMHIIEDFIVKEIKKIFCPTPYIGRFSDKCWDEETLEDPDGERHLAMQPGEEVDVIYVNGDMC